MRFIHTADIHLGMEPEKGNTKLVGRKNEIFASFSRLIDECNKKKVDLLLIAGDLFHIQPKVKDLKEVNSLFGKLKNTKVVLVAGNHDYIGPRSNYSDFVFNENVTMIKSESLERVHFEDINTSIYGLSFISRDIAEEKLSDVSYEAGNSINILLCHGGEGRNLPIDFKKLETKGFDYVALGHIHKPDRICERIYYSGSLEPLDKNETGEHGYIFGEINEKDEIKIEFVPFATRKYIKKEFTITPDHTNTLIVDMVKEFVNSNGLENIYHITLNGKKDPDIEINLKDIEETGIFTRIEDETVPDYDFDEIRRQNSDNIIGMYINKVVNKVEDEDLAKRALYLGLEALLAKK